MKINLKHKKINKISVPLINHARKRLKSANIVHHTFKVDEQMREIAKNKTYHIKTYGCQSNERDTETIKGILNAMGYTWNDDIYQADLIILNTCAVRENAENKVFGEFGLLKKIKHERPEVLLGMCGCMAQSEKVIHRILEKYPYIDFVFGTHNLQNLANILLQLHEQKQMIIDVCSKEGDIFEDLPVLRNNQIKAWVNVMYGCDKFCTYCIVPYTRGKIRSRKKEDILKEVNELINQGYKEITLLGQNVNDYGIDLSDEKINFAQLLDIIANTKIKRIRFATSNPWNWTKQIIDVVKKHDNIMPYFHLPIQSGSEEILKRMNRYTKINDYIDHINYIRQEIPQCAITTDIIVGFPNETDEEFIQTLKLYEQVQFDNAYTFIYSPREGTPAAKMVDTISFDVKKKRLNQLNELVKKYASINNQKYVNKILDVLVEGPSKSNPNKLTGYSPQWKVVNFIGNAKPGSIIKVKITSSSRFSLNGEQVN